MKKITLIVIAIVVLALLMWLGINLFKGKTNEINTNNQQSNGSDNSSQETEPAIKEMTITETTDIYEINIKYPEIRGLSDSRAQGDANKLIKKITDEGIKTFKSDIEENAIKDFSIKSTLDMKYETIYFSNIAVSIKFDIGYYVAGMAHSTNYSSGFNYNLKDNKSLALEDLFNKGVDIFSSLSTICAADLKKQLAMGNYYNENMVKTGTEPKAENFAEFVFGEKELTIIFNVYQVAPYAAGMKLVEIPYTQLSKINSSNELLKSVKK